MINNRAFLTEELEPCLIPWHLAKQALFCAIQTLKEPAFASFKQLVQPAQLQRLFITQPCMSLLHPIHAEKRVPRPIWAAEIQQ